MSRIRFSLATPDDGPAVEAFNQRMARAGARARLSLDPPYPEYRFFADSPVVVERYFAWVDDVLRGGVIVKRMPFWIAPGSPADVAFYKYPVSEGVANPDFGFVGLMIQKFVTQKFPLTYGLGTGSLEAPVAKLMKATGWSVLPVPFRFMVFRASSFLRQIRFLRRKHPAVPPIADLAASTGIGGVVLAALQAGRWFAGQRLRTQACRSEVIATWDSWADALWERVRGEHALIGDRSMRTLATIYPDGNPHLRRLRVSDATDTTVGWAVLTTARLNEHSHFGNASLGAIVDCLAAPGQIDVVVSAALKTLQDSGADLAVVNHSAEKYVRAFARAGMLSGPSNFFLFLSPQLASRSGASKARHNSLFFSRGDGDGPVHLY